MEPVKTNISVAKLWVNRLAFIFYCVIGLLPGFGEKEITAKEPKKRYRQRLIQSHRFFFRESKSVHGALAVLAFNFSILIHSFLTLLRLNVSFMALMLTAGGIAFFFVYRFLNKGSYYTNEYIPTQMKLSYDDRLGDNLKTFFVFFTIPIIWVLWMFNK